MPPIGGFLLKNFCFYDKIKIATNKRGNWMIVFYIALVLLVFCNFSIKKNDGTIEKQNNFDIKTTTCLKGVCAILVVFHHIGQELKFTGVLGNINSYFGEVSVGVFFLLSAFGLVIQYKKRGRAYLKKMLFVSVPKLYLYLVGTNAINYLIFDLPNGCGGGFRLCEFWDWTGLTVKTHIRGLCIQ